MGELRDGRYVQTWDEFPFMGYTKKSVGVHEYDRRALAPRESPLVGYPDFGPHFHARIDLDTNKDSMKVIIEENPLDGSTTRVLVRDRGTGSECRYRVEVHGGFLHGTLFFLDTEQEAREAHLRWLAAAAYAEQAEEILKTAREIGEGKKDAV